VKGGWRADRQIDKAQLSSASRVLVFVSPVTSSDVRFVRCNRTETIFCNKFFGVLIAGFHRGLNQVIALVGCFTG